MSYPVAKIKPLEQIAVEKDGVAAFRAGQPEDACPHQMGGGDNAQRQWWFAGYFAARNLSKFPRWFTLAELLA